MPQETAFMADPQPPLAVSLGLLLVLATLWGASYTFIKIAVETIPPITLIATRTLIAGSLILVVLHLRGLRLPLDRRNLGRFFVQACLNSVVPFVLVAWGTQFVDAGLATILNSLTPVFAFLINWGITRHEVVSTRKALGVAAGLVGICLVVGPSALQGASQQLTAQLAIIIAAMAYGAAVTFGRTFRDLDPMMPAAGSLLMGSVILMPVSLIVDRPWTLAPTASSLSALVALSVFSTALAFTLYFYLLKRIGTVGVTAQAYLRVPIGVGIGMVFLGELPQPTAWMGMALVVVSVIAMTLPSRKSRTATV
ncbi:DMT family transporter [Aureimonas phyllosphaerae]|uniref:DMT family transporter n=1 Tax=Aureimonas phyllosphaerae TaxID=1166078 RepID=UPI003A5BC083